MAVTNPYEDSPDPSRSTIDEETKGMLHHFDSVDLPRTEDATHIPSSSRRYLLPLSLGSNLLLFVVILFQLAHPCFFSARTCVYDRRGVSQDQAMEVMDTAKAKGELMGDVNKIVPEFPTQKVVFMNDSRYSNEKMFKNEKEFNTILSTWEKDMPLGRGFVTVHNASSYAPLQRPWHLSSSPGLDGYSIAYLHQYHCLYMIMRSHGQYRFGRPSHDVDMERHVTHCFDYLRQSMYCAGDSALEGKSAIPGLEMTDGWGDTHICKNQKALLGWVVENRFSNKTGIH
ncbi:hypothetical protein E6O75_ATG10252 [Venturia nashicola]|uniref:Uncharacterized protein n=1 Tax=Venturia nashicola TaxID=86259 RepID=A0A4Z1NBS7_9PEZI|nr:hypothetical protein E6O75_ATG10252 [Venturia nashicola]